MLVDWLRVNICSLENFRSGRKGSVLDQDFTVSATSHARNLGVLVNFLSPLTLTSSSVIKSVDFTFISAYVVHHQWVLLIQVSIISCIVVVSKSGCPPESPEELWDHSPDPIHGDFDSVDLRWGLRIYAFNMADGSYVGGLATGRCSRTADLAGFLASWRILFPFSPSLTVSAITFYKLNVISYF